MSEGLLDLYLNPNYVSQFNMQLVVNPELKWIEDSCFRIINKPCPEMDGIEEDEETPITKPVAKVTMKDYDEETEKPVAKVPLKAYEDNEDARCEEYHDYDIEVTGNGRFKTALRMPHTFYAYIIGSKATRRKQLEEETKTEITIPKWPQKYIIIKGPTERSVALAKHRLDMIAYDLRNKHEITHFLSHPLFSDEIKSNFLKFKDLVVNGGHIDGIDESIFLKVTKLHLTIGVLVLLDPDEITEASEILEDCKHNIIAPQLKSAEPLIIKMKGLEYMNDDPSQVDVLYATVTITNHENPNILQKISDDIVAFFNRKGIMKKETDHVKLHATIMNTRYRKDEHARSNERGKRTKRISFDARPILEKYGNFEFGEQIFTSIHLSHRFSEDKNGYYKTMFAISCI